MRRRGLRTTILIGPQRSRALSAFVAVASGRHVLSSVQTPITLLLMLGCASLGYLYGGAYGVLLGLIAGLVLGPVITGLSRSLATNRMAWLEGRRRWVGLDRTLTSDQLAVLESAAEDWERIDNAMQSQAWKLQTSFSDRVASASEKLMTTLIDEALEGRHSPERQTLHQLAICVDAVSATMGGYERPNFDSPGVAIETGLPAVAELETLLKSIVTGQ